MTKIREQEVLRYLGYRGMKEDEAVRKMIAEVSEKLLETCRPRWTGTILPLSFSEGFPVINGDLIRSESLAKNLRNCTEVILFAATLGRECDRLIQRSEAVSMVRAAVAQAAGAAYIEAYVNEVNAKLREDAKERGLYARPRFSPGYGDLPLEMQKQFSSLLDMPKTIGVTLTDSLLMVPSKSVTACVGLSPENTACHPGGCEECRKRESCIYRR